MDTRPYAINTTDAHASASIATYRAYHEEQHQKLYHERRDSFTYPLLLHIGSK